MKDRYKLAAKLIYISALLGALNALLSYNVFTPMDWITSMLSITFVVILGILVSMRFWWIKYPIIMLILIGLSDFSYIIEDIKEYPINGILSLLMTIIQITASALLFFKDKNPNKV